MTAPEKPGLKHTGRTMLYSKYAVCERFGMTPSEFNQLGRVEQVRLLAYEGLRRDEAWAAFHKES